MNCLEEQDIGYALSLLIVWSVTARSLISTFYPERTLILLPLYILADYNQET